LASFAFATASFLARSMYPRLRERDAHVANLFDVRVDRQPVRARIRADVLHVEREVAGLAGDVDAALGDLCRSARVGLVRGGGRAEAFTEGKRSARRPTEKTKRVLRSFSPSEKRRLGGHGSEKKTRVFETRGEFPAILANRALRRV
jgi:hypothetical protein